MSFQRNIYVSFTMIEILTKSFVKSGIPLYRCNSPSFSTFFCWKKEKSWVKALVMCQSVHISIENCSWKIEFQTQSKDWVLSTIKLYLFSSCMNPCFHAITCALHKSQPPVWLYKILKIFASMPCCLSINTSLI